MSSALAERYGRALKATRADTRTEQRQTHKTGRAFVPTAASRQPVSSRRSKPDPKVRMGTERAYAVEPHRQLGTADRVGGRSSSRPCPSSERSTTHFLGDQARSPASQRHERRRQATAREQAQPVAGEVLCEHAALRHRQKPTPSGESHCSGLPARHRISREKAKRPCGTSGCTPRRVRVHRLAQFSSLRRACRRSLQQQAPSRRI